MAVPIADLVVRFRGDTANYDRAARSVDRRNDRLKRGFSAVQKAAAAAFAVAGAGYAAKKIFDLGAAVEETASKYRTVFGPAVTEVNAFISDNARLLGLTDQRAQDLIGTTGAIAQGMGLSQDASAGFSTELVGLAGDLASFNNIPIERTAKAIQSALTGEREALKTLGIVIRETDVQQRAMANTGKDAVESLNQQERATATLQLITERAGVAVGDLARTQDSAANRARKVGARFRELRDNIATGLLPVLAQFLDWLETSSGGFDTLGDKIKASSDVMVAWSLVGIEAVKAFTSALAAPIKVAFNLGQAIGNAFQILAAEIRGDHDSADAALQLLRFNLRQGVGAAQDMGEAFGDLSVQAAAAWASLDETWNRTADVGAGAVGGGGAGGGPLAGIAEPIVELADSMNVASLATEHAIRPIRTMKNEAQALARAGQNVAMAFAGSLASAVRDGASAFKQFVDYAISQLTRLVAQFAVFQTLNAIFPGSGFVANLGKSLGFLAEGGPARRGQPYVVGERGPELFVPDQSGIVTPNGGNTSITLEVSGMPPATNPLAMARDKDWLAFLHASQRELSASGA